jgi:integrase
MARAIEKWTDEGFEQKKRTTGRHHDGGGLYLDVKPDGSGVFWYFRYGFGGKPNQLHFGPLHSVTLRQARKRAAAARAQLAEKKDPKAERDAERTATRLAAIKRVTFTEAVEAVFAAKRPGWRSQKHANEWRQTLRVYAEPKLGKLPVGEVDTGTVLQVLEPLWHTKTVTAGRLRQRIEDVLDAAKARGWRDGENPARWRGHLAHILPRVRDVAPVEHHKALPYGDIPVFMAQLRQIESVAADCLEILTLTAVRTAEAREAEWSEILGNVWTVPKERTKRFRDLRVALNSAALVVLERRRHATGANRSRFIFPGRNGPIGDTALGDLLTKLRPAFTVHGLRSSFSDWAGETTAFPERWVETALGHKVGSETEVAYRRGDYLLHRFKLINAWATYCAGETSDIIPARGVVDVANDIVPVVTAVTAEIGRGY